MQAKLYTPVWGFSYVHVSVCVSYNHSMSVRIPPLPCPHQLHPMSVPRPARGEEEEGEGDLPPGLAADQHPELAAGRHRMSRWVLNNYL